MAKQVLVSITPRGLLDIVGHTMQPEIEFHGASNVEMKLAVRSQGGKRLAQITLREDGTYVVQTNVPLE